MVPTNLTGVMTRGRNDANEWVKEYKLEYSVDGTSFSPHRDELGKMKVGKSIISLSNAPLMLHTLTSKI